uniref:transient receptor potential cation channel subfamily M member 7 isoform X4 n=1 Tax=Myxine glutinosa TaxID=7769 RepID=UPI00358EF2B9
MSQKSWIEQNFSKRECCYLIPSSKDPHRCLPGCQICQQLIRCRCGRLVGQHEDLQAGLSPAGRGWEGAGPISDAGSDVPWTVELHTVKSQTDAYGVIEFQGGAHSYRAKYVRVSYDTRPELLLQLMVKEWQMELPKLLISVHGGLQNFKMHPKLRQVFGKGLIKAALTTGAWIFTGGINMGIVTHVGDALKEHSSRSCKKICTIGIAPWGLIENRNDLIGQDVVSPYQTLTNPLSKLNLLNNLHSHFILVDDGTVGRTGAEDGLRKQMEKHIALQKIHTRMGQGVPVVCLVAEGGPNLIVTVLEYLKSTPPVPVVVCEGTGRAADILAFVHKNTYETGELCDGIQEEIMGTIKRTFNFSHGQAQHLLQTLLECMRNKALITVFSPSSEEHKDIDLAVLTALLKGTNASSSDQLSLTMAWNRVDIAKNHVFVYGQHWVVGALERAMLDALVMDRMEFVKLLIENGVSMHKFLTFPRLEELYNTKHGPTNPSIYYLVRDVKKSNLPPDYKITLIDKYAKPSNTSTLHTSTSQLFNQRHPLFGTSLAEHDSQMRHNHFLKTAQPYKPKTKPRQEGITHRKRKSAVVSYGVAIDTTGDPESSGFAFPFNELLVWAVLLKRQRMALFLWQHGEESMAKALVACKLYRSLAHEAKQSDVVDDSSEELKQYSREFGQLAVDLLDQSFRQDERMAMKLLTCELRNWSNFTCLKLAVSSHVRSFVAHTCTQMLLADVWMGRLNMRKNSWFKVILSILVPPSIFMLEFKSKAEMSHIPQTQELHQLSQEESEQGTRHRRDIPLDVFASGSTADMNESSTEQIWIRPAGLSPSRRVYEFYHAPIVKFWFNMVAYIGFLMLFTYVVLVKLGPKPSVQEWFVIIYLATTAIEKIREMFMSEPGKIGQKIKMWFDSYWNINDSFGILLFFVGFGLRFFPSLVIIAKIVYSLDIIFWYVRLLDFFAVNQNVGPYIMMIGKMMANMFSIVIIMAIVLLSFGVARQAILFKEEESSWYLARNIVFQPYWMIFGEVYAPEIDACEHIQVNGTDEYPPCTTGVWITPFLQAVYLFVQYIIMVNLLIAFFNNIYLEAKNISDKLWKFHRYVFTMYYYQKPILPPPLIGLSYLAFCVSSLCRQCRRGSTHKSADKHGWLKLYLNEEDLKNLHEFEEHCVNMYFHEKQERFDGSSDERIRVTSERVDAMSMQVKEVSERVLYIKQSMQSLDTQLGHLQDLSALTIDTLRVLSAINRSPAPLEPSSRAWRASGVGGEDEPRTSAVPQVAHSEVNKSNLFFSSPLACPPWNSPDRCEKGRPRLPHSGLLPFLGMEPQPPALMNFNEVKHGATTKNATDKALPIESTLLLSEREDKVTEEIDVDCNNEQGLGAAAHRSVVQRQSNSVNVDELQLAGTASQDLLSASCAELHSSRLLVPTFQTRQHSTAFSPESPALERSRLSSSLQKSSRTALLQQDFEACQQEAETSVPRFRESSSQDGLENLQPVLRETSRPRKLEGIVSPYKSSLDGNYTAMERNNLMRLSLTIPFAPIQFRGDLVTVYRLEESSPAALNNSMSSWAQRGSSIRLEFLSTEEMGGGLRKATKVMCTWADETSILRQGQVYILKSFLPGVIKTWQALYQEDTVLHLCLREIQQQRAAQKLLYTFNLLKPASVPYNPRFLEVLLVFSHGVGQWFTIEEFVSGDFCKYNNNTGEEVSPENPLEESLLAFSHWTYEYTNGEILVLDLQGVSEILTDPSVINSGEKRSHDMVFGPANLGDDAIKNFRAKHRCNSCCRKLKLPDLKRNEYTPVNITLSES